MSTLPCFNILINFRQGQLGNPPDDSTTFELRQAGLFMQGSLDVLFKSPSAEDKAFEKLACLLRPRSSYTRLRLAETSKLEKDLYARQDHAQSKCKFRVDDT